MSKTTNRSFNKLRANEIKPISTNKNNKKKESSHNKPEKKSSFLNTKRNINKNFVSKKEEKFSFNPSKENNNRRDFSSNSPQKKSYKTKNNINFEHNELTVPFLRVFKRQKTSLEDAGKGIRINKFIANSGICARREAEKFITSGNVTVNGKIMNELGYRVQPTDVVKIDGKNISAEKKEYILLNKPKGFITTTSDERGRKTVMDLITGATSARVNPVGRLDRPTTGLLLFTNDGDLLKKLTHPSHRVRKIYHVVLNKKLEISDYNKIQNGLTLEDGFIEVDEIHYVDGAPKNEVGIRIHSGRNRIVRRIFEHLGYEVDKLDRVVFAGLTKKDLPRGHWRHLTTQEVINLKNMA